MDKVITSPLYTIPLSLTGERDVSFRRYGVWCFISVIRNHGVGSPDHIQESDISMLYYLFHSHFI